MKVGYARVSTAGQCTDAQVDALKAYGCERVYNDVASGAKAKRPGLEKALDQLRKGDQLVVTKLDRLGRTMRQLVSFTAELSERGVEFVSLGNSINTSTAEGRLMFHLMAAFAEMERELIQERTQRGIQRARDKGTKFGRSKALTPDKAKQFAKLRKSNLSITEIAAVLGVSRSTLYRQLGESNE